MFYYTLLLWFPDVAYHLSVGNTCYMNASIQALRAIPELQVALSVYVFARILDKIILRLITTQSPSLQSSTPLPAALRDLYATMSRTTDSITPMTFLSTLRQVLLVNKLTK